MPFSGWVWEILIWIGKKGNNKKIINISIKWIVLLLEIYILKIMYDYNPDKLILSLFPVYLEQMDSGVREFRKN